MAVCHYKSSTCLDKKSFERSRRLKLTAPSTSPIGSPRSPQFSTVLCFTGTIVRECVRETRHRNILGRRGFTCTVVRSLRRPAYNRRFLLSRRNACIFSIKLARLIRRSVKKTSFFVFPIKQVPIKLILRGSLARS